MYHRGFRSLLEVEVPCNQVVKVRVLLKCVGGETPTPIFGSTVLPIVFANNCENSPEIETRRSRQPSAG